MCVSSQATFDSRRHLLGGRRWSPSDRAERADQAAVGGEPVPRHLAGIHDVGQATKQRIGQPMAAQMVPDPLDRIEFGAVRRQLQQSDIAGHHEAVAAVSAGSIEDQRHGHSLPSRKGGRRLGC